MAGSRIFFTNFDGSSKWAWFCEDVHAMAWVWMALLFYPILLCAAVEELSGIQLHYPLTLLADTYGLRWVVLAVLGLSFISAFVPVFVFRWNPMASPRRQYGYFSRWPKPEKPEQQ